MDQLISQAILALLSILVVISSIWYFKLLSKSAAKSPPGPWGVPILGYLPFVGSNMLSTFSNLATKYGEIFKVRLGNKLCVVINSPALAKEVVRDHDAVFANRDVPAAALVASYGGKDIVWSPNNSEWRAMRKVFVREMMANRSLELSYTLRKTEVRKSIQRVYKNGKAAVEFSLLASQTTTNVMMNMLWGGLLQGDDEEILIGQKFCALTPKLTDVIGRPNISDFYPFLARFDIQGIQRETATYSRQLDNIVVEIIAKYKKKLSRGVQVEGEKDFLQILLELQQKDGNSIDDTQLKALLVDIVTAGSDTTTTITEWAMAELMNNPIVMEKVQKELSEVVGLDNIVEDHHLPKLKYLDAVLKETLRLHPTAPFLVPRSPSQSSIIGGYTIPKDSMVLINVAYIQKDPRFWDSPREFKPERFLDNECDFGGNNFHYLPFGSGRRICVGLPLAERMLMYFVASLVHSFDWKLPNGQILDMSEAYGIVLKKSVPLVAIPSPRLFDSNLYM
ncbi:labd-13Z-ene-9,15,16-triol synthase, chloroplastic-like isoform X1 [Andrographis paniculata]|uniref:labd-13Z-ene-9,15,16-triol synthase, chloroplastic-like isoform X1 n=1 Tax=Andrographis paniculata TaxID=175694 RepID=UPI0021E84473|nr:labd-13Z-ene-9,15,16-triol synthase, chloroplastic-like isoform X1 [Andrographis paniculata]